MNKYFNLVLLFELFRLSLQEFRYTGQRQIALDIANTSNRDNIQPTSTTATTKKSMTLPARMQPPTEFTEEMTSNCQTQLPISPPLLGSSGTGSIGRVENSKKGV